MENLLPAVESQVGADAVAVNRISIPFLRIQERRWLLCSVDACLAGGWLLLAYEGWKRVAHPVSTNMSSIPWTWVIGGALFWLTVSWLAGAYDLKRADRFLAAAMTTMTVGFVCALAAFVAYYIFLKSYPRPALSAVLLGLPFSVMLWRAFYASALRRPAYATRLLVVGDSSTCDALQEAASTQSAYFQVVGFVSESADSNPMYLGSPVDVERIASRYRIHKVVVDSPHSGADQLIARLCRCMERGIGVVDFNAAYEEIAEKVAVDRVSDAWLAALPTCSGLSSLQEAAMRMSDVVGALFGLALMALLAPAISLAIMLESGGSIVYRQTRLGRGGKAFVMYKFRTMRVGSEPAGERWAMSTDSRITRVGSFLRRTHLDELPQFLNVLRGDMSLVGPRPERPAFTDELSVSLPFYRLRLTVRPGMTGLKQIRVGYAATHQEHLEVLRHDLYYIKHRSVALNLVILARTIGSVVGMDGR